MRTDRSSNKRLLTLLAGISATSMLAVPSLFAAEQLPEFSRMTLTPASQAAANFNSKAPNALASYYTYIPLSNADAVALGFPSACGHPKTEVNPLLPANDPDYTIHTPTQNDLNSTADCYVISLRQFSQPTSLEFLKFVLPSFPYRLANGGLGSFDPGLNLFPGNGMLDDAGVPFVRQDTFGNFAADSQAISAPNAGKMTWAQGYGSGGKGWQPHYPNGPTVRGNAPWAFQTVPFNTLFGAGNNGDPNATGIWHFPAPTIKGQFGRPVYVQWLNELKNVWIEGFDPSNDCGTVPDYCYPFNREVVHVHGAHVGPESDGLAVAWYTPNYATFGEGNFTMANYSWPGRTINGADPLSGQYIYKYPMDQEAGTIWYHTHAVGVTHQNTNAGQAGFFPVTDAHEQSLYANKTLPDPTFEHGFAFQERHFDTNGEMRMPDIARFDRTSPGCTLDAFGLPDPATCTRLNWMYRLGTTKPGIVDPTPALHLVPYVAGAPELTSVPENNRPNCTVDTSNRFKDIKLDGTPFVQCAPFPATETTLEYFGNIPVVNGVVNANYDLQTGQVHRMRFIGGTDSRTWVLQLVKTAGCTGPAVCDPTGTPNVNGFTVYNPAAVVPFWQIGSEQGLLNAPVQRNFIDLMSGERVDVLVDLTGIPAGTTVMLKNLGEDAPYTGVFDLGLAPTSTTIPEVMKFNVVADTTGITPSTVPASIGALRTAIAPLVPDAGYPTKNVALIEITDQYGNTMPTVDARGYIPPGIMVTEYMLLNKIEQWDIINTTVDAHPMHLHQVAFLTVSRAPVLSFNPPESNTITKVFSQSSYIAGPDVVNAGLQMTAGVSPWDQGWKDTIQSIPGYVQRVVALWDIPGEYVWHCHILSHEEHDMMRPSQIVEAATGVAPPAWLGATVNNYNGTIKLNWPSVAGASAYIIHESQDNFVTSNYSVTTGPVNSATLKMKADGTYKFRIAAIIPAVSATTHPKQTTFRTMTGTVTLNKTVAPVAWVGAQQNKTGGNLKVWWPKSATLSTLASEEGHLHYPVEYLVEYTITLTPSVGAPIVVALDPATGAPITGTSIVLNVPADTYTVDVTAAKASWKTGTATAAAAPVTVTQLTLPAPTYLGAQAAGATGVKIWWPTLTGATLQIQQNGVTINPTVLTSGTYSYAIITGLATGAGYTFTIQNIGPVGGIDLPSAVITSATVNL